jgi:hypothetical protein
VRRETETRKVRWVGVVEEKAADLHHESRGGKS